MNYNNNYPNLILFAPGGEGVLGTAIDWTAMLMQTYWGDPDVRLDLMRYAADRLQEAIRNGALDPSDLYFDGDLSVSEIADMAGVPDMYDDGLLANVLDIACRMTLLSQGYISPEEHRKRELQKQLYAEIEKGNLSAAQRTVKVLKNEK